MISPAPNLIERLENLIAALDEAEVEVEKLDDSGVGRVRLPAPTGDALNRIEDARGIAGELLTMIDGR